MLGILIGVLARPSARSDESEWKMRLRARDDDLQRAEAEAADAVVELQSAMAKLAAAERALADVGGAEDAGDETTPRVEELEVELAALHTRICPDPAAHRSDGELVPRMDGDDLTLVPGVTDEAAALLVESGITTFAALAALGESGAVIPESVAETLADRLPEWANAARALHAITYGEA
jgi:predicted flap endonuclease-1-like 5' DNA nuclease